MNNKKHAFIKINSIQFYKPRRRLYKLRRHLYKPRRGL